MTTMVYGLAIFSGSFLLFLIQPMVGKILLPCLGGAPAVWTTCMLFFQTALLAGYLYSEKSIKRLGCEKQSVIHILLMITGFTLLPLDITFEGVEAAFSNPISWLFARLFASIGFLFFIVAANAPLLQRWYSQAGKKDSNDPYFLYSASNAGSLTALVAYPFFFEPLFTLTQLKNIWSGIYVVQTLLVFVCAFCFWQNTAKFEASRRLEEAFNTPVHLPWKSVFKWLMWGFVPCSAMLGVTTHIATDIASGPLLWIFPLSIYLISFILVFSSHDRYRDFKWDRYLLPVSAMVTIMYFFSFTERAWFSIPIHFLLLFLACMSFHGRLAKSRPAPVFLNTFYVWMSVGGILGGIFNGIFAPLFFRTQLEYIVTIVIMVVCATFCHKKNRDEKFSYLSELLVMSAMLVALFIFSRFSEIAASKLKDSIGLLVVLSVFIIVHFFYRFRKAAGIMFLIGTIISLFSLTDDGRTLFVDRSFFGILKITRLSTEAETDYPDLKVTGVKDIFYCLSHGTTLHGVERKMDVRPPFPLSYYSREGPVGDLFSAALIKRWAKKIGVVGLGCGTIAWYGRSWQDFDFYEIDPLVVKIATDPKYFTYLKNCRSKFKVIVGDARVNLRLAQDNLYDLLIMDGYSSDSVPIHLLTKEAFELYLKKLKPNGLLVLHLSNRFFKLGPIVNRNFAKLGLKSLERFDDPKSYSMRYDWYDEKQLSKSYWVVASRSDENLKMLKSFGPWCEMENSQAYSAWTDDYANLLQVYNWR